MVDFKFQWNREKGSPAYYQQVADQLGRGIEEGVFPPGSRLYTEQELMERTGLSRGTIKAAYNLLQEKGLARKVRGSGVYVRERTDPGQFPEQVMELLYQTLNEQYGLRPSEVKKLIFDVVNHVFKMPDPMRVVTTDCSIELLPAIKRQIEGIPGLEVTTVKLDDILYHGDKILTEQVDLILTTKLHLASISCYTEPKHIPVEAFSLQVTDETVKQLRSLRHSGPACTVYRRKPFIESVRHLLHSAGIEFQLVPVRERDEKRLEQCVGAAMPVLLPPDYLEHCDNHMLQAIYHAKSNGGIVIPLEFEVTSESMERIEAVVKRMHREQERTR